jgi:putative nucleotidyltransferase with HDIG domain
VEQLSARLAAEPSVATARAALTDVGNVWIVGGAIRDALLGRSVVDLDLASGTVPPEEVARTVAAEMGGAVFPLSEEFGAWRAIGDGWVCDVTALQGTTIDDDLALRDFTVNAMAMSLYDDRLLDPFEGRRDLEEARLRLVREDAYERDPLRPLRLIRLAAELGLAPDEPTIAATRRAAARVPEASGERIFAELKRTLSAHRAVEAIELASDVDVLEAVLPEVEAMRGIEQNQFHHLDVFGHTLDVLRHQIGLEGDLEGVFGDDAARLRAVLDEPLADDLTRGQALRFGSLLHDIGKPGTRKLTDSGRVTFIGHDALGAQMVQRICNRLRTSERLREFIAAVTRHHLALGFLVHQRPLSRRTIYKYLKHCEPVEVEVTLLTCADRLATRGRNADAAIVAHLDLARELMSASLDWRETGAPEQLVRGDDLAQALNIEHGPRLGSLLAQLEEAAYAGEVGSRDQAVEYARRLRDNPGS